MAGFDGDGTPPGPDRRPGQPVKPAGTADVLRRLLLPAGCADWDAAITIEGGAVATQLLGSGDRLRLWDFSVDGGADAPPRLARLRLDATQPDAILGAMQAAGLVRRVDALIALDAALAADTSRLLGWWINAGLVLKPGGRIVMTLADATTKGGFQRLLRDIRRFWKFQGRSCPKLGYQSQEIATYLLTALGFEIERLEPWSAEDGRAPRDLCLVARLARPAQAETFRPALRGDAASGGDAAADAREGYAAFWTREAARAIAGNAPLRPDSRDAHDRLLANADADAWSHAIEIGGGDARYTAEALAANPALTILGFDVSPPVMQAAAARLAPAVAAGRLSYHLIEPTAPDGILRVVEDAGLARRIDAVFSIDALTHVGLQDQIAYWISAALVLKPGGWLIFSAGDATSPAGFTRLVTDLPAAHRAQGCAGARLEYLSPSLVKALLENCGFEVPYIWNWNPADGGDAGRDLYVMARLAQPQRAEALRAHLALTAEPPPPTMAEPPQHEPIARKARDMAETPTDETNDIARALGQAYWRQQQIQQNPDVPREEMRDRLRDQWPASRREYTKLGHMVLRQLANMGFAVNRAERDPGAEGGTP